MFSRSSLQISNLAVHGSRAQSLAGLKTSVLFAAPSSCPLLAPEVLGTGGSYPSFFASPHSSSIAQPHLNQQPPEQYSCTMLLPSYLLQTAGQAHQIIPQPTQQYRPTMYSGMDGSYLSIFASPNCSSTGQVRQTLQRPTDQYHTTIPIQQPTNQYHTTMPIQQPTHQYHTTMPTSLPPAVNMVVLLGLSFLIALITLIGVSPNATELNAEFHAELGGIP